jgi:hypothetical protein
MNVMNFIRCNFITDKYQLILSGSLINSPYDRWQLSPESTLPEAQYSNIQNAPEVDFVQ